MKNLLTETLKIMSDNGKEPEDVVWCGTTEWMFGWSDFEQLANVEYDDGYGRQTVASDLLVVGTDWWLERHEYDGSEWWEFKQTPKQPKEIHAKPPKRLKGGCWSSLSDINSEDVSEE